MKMSLCKSFRFFVVSTTLVLSIVGSPVPGRVNRHKSIADRHANQDLVQQGSLTVEMKNEFKGLNVSQPNSLKLKNVKGDAVPLVSGEVKKNISKAQLITTQKVEEMNITSHVEKTTEASSKYINNATSSSTERVSDSHLVKHLNNETENSNTKNIGENITTANFSLKVDKNEKMVSQINTTVVNVNQTEFAIIENNLVTVDQMTTAETEQKTDHGMILEKKILAPENKTMDIQPTVSVTSESSVMSSSKNPVTAQTGKKYTVIERNRVSTTTEETISTDSISMNDTELSMSTVYEQPTTIADKAEVMIKSETAQARISLQDTMTSNIPSLEKLKTDLLSFPKYTTRSETDFTTTSIPDESVTTVDMTTPVMKTTESALNSESPNTVSSKRGGYMNLSAKVISATEDFSGLKLNGTEALQGPFDAETPDTQDETSEYKVENRMESQGQLAEDAIKEELLKEETLNDNEENAKRYREEPQRIQTETPSMIDSITSNITQLNNTDVKISNTAPDDNLSVKPINNTDKLKNTILYPVNPNYKPLKKIEVQPAKPFVRDPDDNSWRNESLSSLGIVFKPKNSSKPFTQVLKNKTETEWNTISEKEKKSEVPDLRVRLEQIAQKRKSKKKKIDSFGNIYYTDYEENSSSEENTRTSHVEDPSVESISTTEIPTTTDITIVTPVPTVPLTSLSTNAEIKNASTVTTIATPTQKTEITPTSNKERNNINNVKTKLFNLFDYYDSNDDDEIAEYLNMARIDLKKYTVPIQTTFTSFTSPPLQILYTTPIAHYTSERKGTIQYFPPRTTKRPRKSKHNNARHKINQFTLTESPKNVLPISYHKMVTTPFDRGMYYTDSPDIKKLKDQNEPKNSNIMDSDLYLTPPPLTTLPDESFGVIGSDGEYNRDNFVIKHYKDYMNEATQSNEPQSDKNSDFVGFTQPPQGITVSDYMKDATAKDNTKLNEEYDYETQFRKDVLDRFVANFNENSKRFKSDFPILYNNSIVHAPSNYNDKDVAMSRAYFRRPYSNQGDYKPLNVHEPYDPNCDNVTVELSPAYELHYYVPEQEEKQEAEAKPVTLPVRFRL